MKLLPFLAVLVVFFSTVTIVSAAYVLPYPSYMPGNKMYTIARLIDRATRIWYYGNMGSFKYHLKLADKYLVEAKTLCEYSQFLLAADALKRSDAAFALIPSDITRGEAAGEDMTAVRKLAGEAARKHIDVLGELQKITPKEIQWQPEKSVPTTIPAARLFDEAITIRSQLVQTER